MTQKNTIKLTILYDNGKPYHVNVYGIEVDSYTEVLTYLVALSEEQGAAFLKESIDTVQVDLNMVAAYSTYNKETKEYYIKKLKPCASLDVSLYKNGCNEKGDKLPNISDIETHIRNEITHTPQIS